MLNDLVMSSKHGRIVIHRAAQADISHAWGQVGTRPRYLGVQSDAGLHMYRDSKMLGLS